MAFGLLFACFLCGLAAGADAKFPSMQDLKCNSCPPEWTWYGGSCYKFEESAKDWADAEKYCNLFGGNLASYHSKDDYKFIRQMIRKAAKSDQQCWVGGTDAVEDGMWFWSDGSKFDYINWGQGEPNNRGGNQKCIDINVNGMDFVNDEDCSQTYAFVCCMKAKP